MDEAIRAIEAESEAKALAPDENYPLILMAGRHMDFNANTLMRNPEWNKGRRACTLAIHPRDASNLGLADGSAARVVTEAGQVTAEVEITDEAREGHVVIPHGFGWCTTDRSTASMSIA